LFAHSLGLGWYAKAALHCRKSMRLGMAARNAEGDLLVISMHLGILIPLYGNYLKTKAI